MLNKGVRENPFFLPENSYSRIIEALFILGFQHVSIDAERTRQRYSPTNAVGGLPRRKS